MATTERVVPRGEPGAEGDAVRTRNHITAPRRRARPGAGRSGSATIPCVHRRSRSRSVAVVACLGATLAACEPIGLSVPVRTNAGAVGAGAPAVPASTGEVVLSSPAPPTAVPRLGSRNPFAFPLASRPAAAAPASVSAAPVEEMSALPAAVPLLTLIGIAEGRTGPTARRTAIISGVGEVFLATVGEAVTPRYVVHAVGDSHVELADRTSGDVLRLVLRTSR